LSFSVSHVSFQYNAEKAAVLKDVSFEILPGQVTAIVGPSGCGKSTLVSILSGVIPDLITGGVVSGSMNVRQDALISVVSQSPENQLFGYGVEDAIAFGIENLGLDNESIVERMEYVLDLLNIQHLRKRSIATLSGGQRQAVCIASVLAMQPDILIMDEPVSSLDPNGKKMIQAVLGSLKASGQTIVIVDNNLEWSANIVDHIIGLLDGAVAFDGDKDTFFADGDLQKKLCVTLPQETEIFLALSERIADLQRFYSLEEAQTELARFIGAMVAPTDPDQLEPATEQQPAGEEILTAKGICKTFRDGFNALIDVDVSFRKGSVVAILGQNGSGKTTLVKHLNGLYRPTKGTITYRGKETTGRSVAQISKDIILVFQNPELMLFEETVLSELTFCARAQKVPFSEEAAIDILRQYGLFDHKDEFPVNLSMGQKHLLTILSVLFSSAEVVILDEPTLGMDLFQKRQLVSIIEHLKAEGKTVIVISHEIPLVFQVADEIIVLNDGFKLMQGSRQTLAACDALFERINISLPPVVRLAKHFGFTAGCCDVPSFIQEVETRLAAGHPVTVMSGGQ
jgi:energy-coupling factor transport system ATP-binding protein